MNSAEGMTVAESGEGPRHFAQVSADLACFRRSTVDGHRADHGITIATGIQVELGEWYHHWAEGLGRRLARRQDDDSVKSQQGHPQQPGHDPGLDDDAVGQ